MELMRNSYGFFRDFEPLDKGKASVHEMGNNQILWNCFPDIGKIASSPSEIRADLYDVPTNRRIAYFSGWILPTRQMRGYEGIRCLDPNNKALLQLGADLERGPKHRVTVSFCDLCGDGDLLFAEFLERLDEECTKGKGVELFIEVLALCERELGVTSCVLQPIPLDYPPNFHTVTPPPPPEEKADWKCRRDKLIEHYEKCLGIKSLLSIAGYYYLKPLKPCGRTRES